MSGTIASEVVAQLFRLRGQKLDMTKVFLVNDKFEVLQSLNKWFAGKGCYVRTFSKSEPLFSALHELVPDVIVMNATLRDENGSELYGQIKDEFAAIPVVLFSAEPLLNEIKNNCAAYLLN